MMAPMEDAPAPAPVTRIAAYALCLDDARRILLCRTATSVTPNGEWMLPGGGVEFGEDPADAVLRELDEETGLTGRVEGIAGVVSRLLERRDWARGADVHNVAIVYRIAVDPGELRDEIDGSTDTCAWLSRADVDGLPLWPVAREALRMVWADPAEPGAVRPGPLAPDGPA
jgi:8-oxo-dGTP pyrophosphatase MutT (NUDIX family)